LQTPIDEEDPMTTLFRRILVPHDFSVQANEALRIAIDLAATHGGRLMVLHVVTPPVSIGEIAWMAERDLATALRERLGTEVAAAVKRRRIAVRADVVVGDPVTRILAAARKADSIVMATLGQTGIARWHVGSVAEKVVRLSPVPVLTVRGRGKSRGRRTGPTRARRTRA
jgi:nucleotide-binding universal stress UspA family protein